VIERMEGMPEGVLGLRFSGEISRGDYEEVLMPAIDEAAGNDQPFRCLCELDADFEGYEAGAVWEDIKTGAKYVVGHHANWHRMALVTDVEWIRRATALFGWMSPGELKLFGLTELEAAKEWVAG
jgi:hypothetical protein